MLDRGLGRLGRTGRISNRGSLNSAFKHASVSPIYAENPSTGVDTHQVRSSGHPRVGDWAHPAWRLALAVTGPAKSRQSSCSRCTRGGPWPQAGNSGQPYPSQRQYQTLPGRLVNPARTSASAMFCSSVSDPRRGAL